MKTKEELCRVSLLSRGYDNDASALSHIRAWHDGWDACEQSMWRYTREDLPDEGEYVLVSSDSGIEPAVWNDHYEVWDNAEGDDFLYEKDYVEAWMRIPTPKTEKQ